MRPGLPSQTAHATHSSVLRSPERAALQWGQIGSGLQDVRTYEPINITPSDRALIPVRCGQLLQTLVKQALDGRSVIVTTFSEDALREGS